MSDEFRLTPPPEDMTRWDIWSEAGDECFRTDIEGRDGAVAIAKSMAACGRDRVWLVPAQEGEEMVHDQYAMAWDDEGVLVGPDGVIEEARG